MKHLGLFEGIGGFSLAARWMGWETVAWCEWNEFGQRVLRYHFPEAEGFGDITKTDFTKYANKIDIVTGGFPCQPYSSAGKRKGKEDERHLWPQMLRAIREIQPGYVVGENVSGLLNWSGGLVFDEVQADLENEGYEILPFLLPACGKNAPHKRERIWFVAYSQKYSRINASRNEGQNTQALSLERLDEHIIAANPDGKSRKQKAKRGKQIGGQEWQPIRGIATAIIGKGNVTDTGLQRPPIDEKQTTGVKQQSKIVDSNTNKIGLSTEEQIRELERVRHRVHDVGNLWQKFPTQSPICGRNDGLPGELDGITIPKWRKESLKSYGNAIVPDVALEIFKAIQFTHDHLHPSV